MKNILWYPFIVLMVFIGIVASLMMVLDGFRIFLSRKAGEDSYRGL